MNRRLYCPHCEEVTLHEPSEHPLFAGIWYCLECYKPQRPSAEQMADE